MMRVHLYVDKESSVAPTMYSAESEEANQPGVFSGHTDNFLPVLVEGDGLSSNQIVDVYLEENTPSALKGRKVV